MPPTSADEITSGPLWSEAIERVAHTALQRPEPPRASYRVQLHAGFTFRDTARIVPYLARLGISHLYASPHLKANPGSTHGYDVVDYGCLNPELGTDEDYAELLETLQAHGMSLLVDFVPNHMGIAGGANAWWQDVLENGPSSVYAAFFDIDWQPLKPELRNKVLLPVLGDQYGVVLENGELRLTYEDGSFSVLYYGLRLPVAPPTYADILAVARPPIEAAYGPEELPLLEFDSIVTAFERLPPQTEQDAGRLLERQREQIVAKRRLAQLAGEAEPVAAAIDAAIAELNGTPGEPRSFDAFDALLARQSYRLSFWKVASEEINYRRFFAINELAALRQEEPRAFEASHEFLLGYVGQGQVGGVRIDHPDGLWDPAGYFRSLQRAAFLARCAAALESDPALDGVTADDWREQLGAWWDEQWASAEDRDALCPLYVVVEKILEHDEELPPDWAVSGTVGYEFARQATGLLVDADAARVFDELYARFIDRESDLPTLVYECKQMIMRTALASGVNVLTRALDRITERHRRTRDFTLATLRNALREVIACFPVYRSYTVCEAGDVATRDRRYIDEAVRQARHRNRAVDPSVFEFLRGVLLLRYMDDAGEAGRHEHCRFVMKFQQLTGPVMAKGLEDTAFYIYNRLAALNEVGGSPGHFGVSPQEAHAGNLLRRERWPDALLTSSTHDTKRSEDVRARIAVLSELPREWRVAVNRWARLNRRHKSRVGGRSAPDRNEEYLLYQTLLGAWPHGEERANADFVERIVAYMRKVSREAQVHTSWVNPDEAYDEAMERFVRSLLDPVLSECFLADFLPLQRRVQHFGCLNGLAQQLLKLTSPGVPDIYQGTELWDLSLVDPDNRRPVDFERRSQQLEALVHDTAWLESPETLLTALEDGRLKLEVTRRLLECRRADPDLFARGDYAALEATGPQRDHVFAFVRRLEGRTLLVAWPRLMANFVGPDMPLPMGEGAWGETVLLLPDGLETASFRSLLNGAELAPTASEDGGQIRLADLFETLPVAAFVSEGDG